MTQEVLVIVDPGFEEVEATISTDLLRRAGLSVTIASTTDQTEVQGMCGLSVKADALLLDVKDKDFSCLVIPGGSNVHTLIKNPDVAEFLKKHHQKGRLILAVCGGPILLYHAGILDGKKYTASPTSKDVLLHIEPQAVVEDGNIITARDLVATFEASLKIINRKT
ncbi:MAG: hypothetical protein A2007_03325 [Verrucomicrobia bacterium GWC2_42_7]|nr:MAG: hypothetical protein A2007_03325 [Verrucomicrobia bacterium GWC2_42_7]